MQRKYAKKNYDALLQALRRKNLNQPGILATFLLDVFVENRGLIRAAKAYELGLCSEDEKEFRDWRKKLCDLEWLEFIIENNKNITYRPGKKLLKYINREKQNRSEIASMDDVRAATEGFATKAELEELRQSMGRIIEIIDPPFESKKIKKLSNGGYDGQLRLVRKKDGSL